MMPLRTKLVLAAAPFAITSATLVAMSTTADGGHDAYLVRVASWILAFGFVVCLVVWDVHRVGEMRQEMAIMKAALEAAEKRAAELERRVTENAKRIQRLEDELTCREVAKILLAGADDAEILRALLHVEDAEGRN